MNVLLLFAGSFSCAVAIVTLPCNMVFDLIQFQVVVGAPSGLELCALSPIPSDVFHPVNSVLNCALNCKGYLYCENFNYKNSSKICELFYHRPMCYGWTSGCTHYQAHKDQPNAGIPAENCSSPYTYNGTLLTGCSVNLTGDGCNKCLIQNQNITNCITTSSGDDSVTYQAVNVTIPTFAGVTLIMSFNNWIVIQQRTDAGVSFNRSWSDYKSGFGDIAANFWLGLEKMHQLTSSTRYRLRVELQTLDLEKWYSAEYDSFLIASETYFYALNISGYVGDAGDALNHMNPPWVFQNGMNFSTYDNDNDPSTANFALITASGFWFNSGYYTDLNAVYSTYRFSWVTLSDLHLSPDGQLKTCRMMIKVA